MTPERWARIQELFAGALETDAGQRAEFLREQCGADESLRREVESLLSAGAQASEFFERPAAQRIAFDSPSSSNAPAGGEFIGPYRLVSKIGQGGMGEVWKAYDPRVCRDVAIKFCDERFSERFAREARAIAALNHPNICQLYDAGANFLVMEFVEGAQPSGRLPLSAALAYGRQITAALEAAHERGIVHRDLKPANILVRADGTVKVLDFGIAKVFEAEPAPVPAQNNESGGGQPETQAGSVLGTLAWMSPEQARGGKVDKRADIWGFGALLYHALTGLAPFERSNYETTREAVLNEEPDMKALPFEVRRLVAKCLQKDPAKRLRDAGDAWDLLDSPGGEQQSSSPWLRRAGLAGGAAAMAVLGAFLWSSYLKPANDDRLKRFDLDLGPDVSLDISGAADLALSPDGNRLAFVSRGKLFVREFDQTTARQIGSVQGIHSPFFSPDGQWIAYFSLGKLRKISVQGGAPVDICATSANFAGGSWAPDGTIIAPLSPTSPLQRVPASGGTPQPLTSLDHSRGESTHRQPQVLPDGRAVLFTSHTAITGLDDADIDVLSLKDGTRKRLIHGGSFGRYLPSGHLTYVSRGVLYAAPFDLDRLELRGDPVPVLKDITYSLFGSAQIDHTASGMLVYRPGGADLSAVTLQKIDRRGNVETLISKPGTYLNPRVSPSADRILLSYRAAAEMNLSVYDPRRSVMNALVAYPGGAPSKVWAPFAAWSPDGRFVVFRGEGGLFWMKSDNVGRPRLLLKSTLSLSPTSFSPDGRTLLFYQGPGLVGLSDIWSVSIDNNGEELKAGGARPFVQSNADENHARFSPDGRWVTYAAADTASSPQVFVKPWPDDGRAWQISSEGGSQPVFSRSGPELLFLNEDMQMMSARFQASGKEFVAERPRVWSLRRLANLGEPFWLFDVTPNEDAIIALVLPDGNPSGTARNRVAVLLNFFDLLNRVAPRK